MKNHMRYVIILILGLVANIASAQQVNPVPDYTFANRMSAGRNTMTDTAAYFSIGPRYGAIRGMMPPMVVDTASVSGNKRNGLLIFSIQKNKFLYWDSVGSKWAEMAGTGGSAITGTGVAGYLPEFTTTTNLDSTSLYHSAGRFAIGGTTTSNGIFSVFSGQSYFDTSLKVGTQTFLADEGKNEVYVNTTSDAGAYSLQISGNQYNDGNLILEKNVNDNIGLFARIKNTSTSSFSYSAIQISANNNGVVGNLFADGLGNSVSGGAFIIDITTNHPLYFRTNNTNRGQIEANGNFNYDAGTLFVDAANNFVGLGTSSPTSKADVLGTLRIRTASFSSPVGGAGMEFSFRTSDSTGYITTYSRDYSGYRNQAYFALSHKFSYGTGGAIGLTLNSNGETLLNTETDAGAYALQVAGAIYNTTTITTGAPTSGTAKPWRLGEVATVSPTSPNRTIRVEIDGTIYYIHAKTTND